MTDRKARFVLAHKSLPGGGCVATRVEQILEFLNGSVAAAPEPSSFYWLDVEAIRAAEMDQIANAVGLHDVTVKDCLFEDMLVSDEKWERFSNYLFVIADILAPVAGDKWRTENVNVIVTRHGAISLRNNAFPELAALARNSIGPSDSPSASRARSHSLRGLAGGSDRVLLAIMEVVLAKLAPLAAAAADEADALDLAVLTTDTPQEELLGDIARVRQRLAKLGQSLQSKRETLASLCSHDVPQVSDATRIRLRAVLDQVIWKLARVEAAQETLRGASANLFAQVQLRASRAANETNRVIKVLSLLLAITTPLTLVASVFGMNVFPLNEVVLVDRDKNGWGLMMFLAIFMATTTLGLLWWADRQGMFRASPAAEGFELV